MSLKHAVIIVSILLTALLVTGLILCRPMGPENYASGVFNFAAVSELSARAWQEAAGAPEAQWLAIEPDSDAFEDLTEAFENRGFGRTLGSIFSEKAPAAQEGDICWAVTFRCGISQSSLTAEYTGGVLRLSGSGTVTVTTQDKSEWAKDVYDTLISLYPEPEPEPEPEISE